ncbi:sensor histidine kinase [Chelatococcus sp. SYSU_G07232]|uniref:histidine kinase n=1 Tax=Chelatococcus albus TaxID=3047466 RepID=A0ABT7ACM1_9HYPH|nr:sensor histidine kinase [Chelatococcus sp. SYSU_G07232]MDJ1156805.1 sensor histidine kinase [Chelatococcus sp. SYSU_G07232]
MPRHEPSLFARLAGTITLVLAVGAMGLTTAAWYYARAAADEAYDRLLVGAALQIAEALTVQDGALTVELPISAFEMLALSERDRIFYKVTGPRGDLLAGYPDLDGRPPAGAQASRPTVSDGRFRGVPVRLASVGRVFADPAVQGWARVVVAQTAEARWSLARDLTLNATVLVLAMSALALGGVVFAVRHALRPLARIETALTARDPQDLTPLSLDTPREIRALVAAINHFMERLKGRMTLMQRFIADAAHQLRTPLAALSAQVDLLAHDTDLAQRRHHLERVQERTGQLGRLANQLLSHAMVIHRTEAVPFERLDIVALARRTLRDAVPVSISPDIVVSFEGPDHPVHVNGDQVSIREAIANVIDNALRHGAAARLGVCVRTDACSAFVDVFDDGPGIPPGDWQRVTQRFGSDPSGGGRSTGLGFAIAREVATAHGGALSFREPDESGFTVTLSFPRILDERS